MSFLSNQNLWLNIDKPTGYSSAAIVKIVKKITKAKKVGHAGTLDPIASGVLPIAINKATKSCHYIVSEIKKYYFEISWGETRDSDDKAGRVIETSLNRPQTLEIINCLTSFVGTIKQIPPQYSAVRVNGKQAYKSARRGQEVELLPREVKIYNIKLIGNNEVAAQFEVTCSKGTYIRSIARDLSKQLGVCGYISKLRRLQVGNFSTNNTISLDKLKNIVNYSCPNNLLLQLRDVLNFIPEIELNNFDSNEIKNGQFIKSDDKSDDLGQFDQVTKTLTVKIINNGELIGLAKLENGWIKPVNIF